jgi:hypothetical protein
MFSAYRLVFRNRMHSTTTTTTTTTELANILEIAGFFAIGNRLATASNHRNTRRLKLK